MPRTEHTKKTMQKQIIVATRASKLAYIQTLQVVDKLRLLNPDCDFIVKKYTTQGDEDRTTPLTEFGGTGFFVKELEQALLSREADIAIHSLKDVPTTLPEGLELSAFPEREMVEDVLLTRRELPLDKLPPNPIIGTGSLRRRMQIKKQRPDAIFKDIRGNIDTRIAKLQNKEYDAIVLAGAGLRRLYVQFSKTQVLSINQFLPAVGQGALAIESREGDGVIKSIVAGINHLETQNTVQVERVFLRAIEGGCKFPVAAYAMQYGPKIELRAMAGDYKQGKFISVSNYTPIEKSLAAAEQLANELKARCQEKQLVLGYE